MAYVAMLMCWLKAADLENKAAVDTVEDLAAQDEKKVNYCRPCLTLIHH